MATTTETTAGEQAAAPEEAILRPGRTDRASTHDPRSTVAPEPDGTGEPSPDDSGIRVFPCEWCGADLELAIGLDSLRCEYCGSTKEIDIGEQELVEHDLEEALERLRKAAEKNELAEQGDDQPAEPDLTGSSDIRRCGSCGAEVVFEGSLASQQCAYCAAPLQKGDSDRASSGLPVDGLIPFRIDRPAVQKALRRWVSSRWFVPGRFKSEIRLGRFQGIYLPYWTFDAMTLTQYAGRRGDAYTKVVGRGKNRRHEQRIRWTPRSGRFQRFFDDVLVVAASKVPTQLLKKLEPWPLEQAFLAGLQARLHDLDLEDGFRTGKANIDQALEHDTRRRIGGTLQEIHQLNTRYDALTFKQVLLPLWLLTYRYGDRQFQVVVDALRGTVYGERPISWVKVVLLVLFLLFVLAIALAFGSLVGLI